MPRLQGVVAHAGKEDLYRTGFTIAFAIRSVDSIQSLDPRLRRVMAYYTNIAPQGLWQLMRRYGQPQGLPVQKLNPM